ncbi:MAG: hypothetical protein WC665_11185 [Sulfurimonas sp.]|jgi:hypothetical protein
MNKIVLSALAALTIGTVAASASDVKFYTDANGQVFTMPAEGRTEVVSKETPVFAKTSKLDFSGLHYLGYDYKSTSDLNKADITANGLTPADKTGIATGAFEMRRNYVQVKGFFFEDPKSYARVTLDATYNADGYNDVIVKYAYIYLNEVLPFTGVELGQAHRPWIDYEEHNGWFYRSISKVLTEASETADLSNSADLGVNFKTNTDHFTSEIGLFNGEGYHGKDGANDKIGTGNSLEWRLTAAMLGNGKAHRHDTKDTWFDASFWGQLNAKNSSNEDANGDSQSYKIYGLHTVYNMPALLLSAQYIKADNDNTATYKKNGSGYSANATYRMGKSYQYEILARADGWTAQRDGKDDLSTSNYIYGAAWKENKNLKWILNGQTFKAKDHGNYAGAVVQDYTAGLLTAEVSW